MKIQYFELHFGDFSWNHTEPVWKILVSGAKYVVMQYALRLYSPKMHLCGNLNITFHFLF